ncbi:MAG TPA: biopolymer transporter ExbD [Bacteroidales bacterium]|nr:biopolymer transporter ExbD [Bacteroidales bacterium]
MSKVKSKKHSTFIDMTAMSDVTVLLLTFFMLTSTFLPKEPVQVTTPGSVSEIKIPDANVLTILISNDGRVFLNLDLPKDKLKVLEMVGKDYSINFTPAQKKAFLDQPNIGMPVGKLQQFLDLKLEDQDKLLKEGGIPTDSTNNQFKHWVMLATSANKDLAIAIKADEGTPYPKVKNVLNTLQDLKLNRYSLVTVLKPMPAGF